MSWKGFQKGIVRTPQSLLQKMQHAPKDPMFVDVQQRFDDIEMQIQRLHSECKRYWDAIGQLLHHQIEYTKIIEQLFNPVTGRYILAEGEVQEDPSSDPDAVAAAVQYRNTILELQQLIQPELEMIETRILKPADDLLVIINSTKKMLTKREHKRLDLDRHAQALRKVQDRDERSVKQEEKMYKVENDYEIAMEEYNYYNELLKQELPKLFAMEGQFIKPLFQSLYFMQLNIYYTFHVHMAELKIPHFNLQGDIVQGYRSKLGDVSQRAENIGIVHFRTSGNHAKLEALGRRRSTRSTSGDSDLSDPWGESQAASPSSSHAPPHARRLPPKYEEAVEEEEAPARPARPARPTTSAPPARPPRPGTAAPPVETCTALYDFDAQNAGDLTFRAGDCIEIVKRTEKAEGWWTGKLNGQQGTFPGNYVELSR